MAGYRPGLRRAAALRVVVLLLGVSLMACTLTACADTNTTLTAAADLSKAGQSVAGAAQQAAAASDEQFTAYKDAEVFLHAFANAPPEDPALGALEDSNQAELAGRARMFVTLGRAYAAFGTLAASNAPAQFQQDVGDLFNNIDNYRQAVGKSAVNPGAVALATPSVGWVTGLVERRLVLAASDQLRAQVVNIIAVMSDPLVRRQFLGTRTQIVNELAGDARLMTERGLLSPKPFFATLAQSVGVGVADDFDTRLRRDVPVRRGVDALIAARQTRAVAQVGQSYDSSLQALKALLPLHDDLKEGRTLPLTQLDQTVRDLQVIAISIHPAAEGAHP